MITINGNVTISINFQGIPNDVQVKKYVLDPNAPEYIPLSHGEDDDSDVEFDPDYNSESDSDYVPDSESESDDDMYSEDTEDDDMHSDYTEDDEEPSDEEANRLALFKDICKIKKVTYSPALFRKYEKWSKNNGVGLNRYMKMMKFITFVNSRQTRKARLLT